MKTRRTFLKTGAAAVAGAAGFIGSQKNACGQFGGTPPLPPFVDPLPLPTVHKSTGSASMVPKGYDQQVTVQQYEVPMMEGMHKWHRDLPATRIWGYTGVFPGPTFEVRAGQPVSVRFVNNLPDKHLFPYAIDSTLFGSQPGVPEVRATVHLHGAKVLPDADGHPESWYTPGTKQTGPTFASDTNYYPNDQSPTMLWYHDHVIGITRLNVLAGLAGLYFIRDQNEDSLNLPKGQYEIPLVFQDKTFKADGSIDYPFVGFTTDHPIWQADFFTDTPVVNGKIRPFLNVEPRKYRFRCLNSSNSRYFNLHLPTAVGAKPFVWIGGDQGFLPAPVGMDSLLLGPAERADIIIDFSSVAGQMVMLTNDAKQPFGVPFDFPFPIPPPPSPVMQFRVATRVTATDTSVIPTAFTTPKLLNVADATVTRDISMAESTNAFAAPRVLLLENKLFEEPVSSTPAAGSTEIWRFINAVVGAHPQHIHLAEMQVIDRQPFDTIGYIQTGDISFQGPATGPLPNEVSSVKDTINVLHGQVVRILARFELPSHAQTTANQRFRYVHHCHILEHEDNEMMRPLDFVVR